MLAYYTLQTTRLLQNPGAPTSLYATADLTSWINTARGQLAGEAECIRRVGTVVTVPGQRNYNFSALSFGDTSVSGAIHVRRIMYGVASGFQWIAPRAWPWFDLYHLNNPVPTAGPPQVWSQYGQGSAGQGSITGEGVGTMSSGSFYIDPPPDLPYALNCDCVCYPAALTVDNDPEALPYLFTDAVPFFAAYYALLSAQTNARAADAERYYGHYQTFVERARRAANPSVNRTAYEQADDPVKLNKLGLASARQQAGG